MNPDLLPGPPRTGRELCDYRDMPGYAIPPRDLPTEDRKDS